MDVIARLTVRLAVCLAAGMSVGVLVGMGTGVAAGVLAGMSASTAAGMIVRVRCTSTSARGGSETPGSRPAGVRRDATRRAPADHS